MPRYTVTVLRHQWAQLDVEAADEDDAMTLVIEMGKYDHAELIDAPWETTLVDPIEVEPATADAV